MSLSLGILSALIILLMFGAGQRILDQMRLNDKQAILVLLSIVIGILIPPIYIGKYFCFSIGGFLIPFIICIYMLVSAGWSRDLLRATIGTLLVAGIVYGLEWLLPATTPEDIVIDPMYIYGIVAGVVAYCLGRSRRNAFVCSVLGISLAMTIQFIVSGHQQFLVLVLVVHLEQSSLQQFFQLVFANLWAELLKLQRKMKEKKNLILKHTHMTARKTEN